MNEFLIRKAKKGDKDAFCRLMDEQVQSMYKVASAYLKNDEDVADAIQDTILSCYENLKSLKQNRYFKTWMIRILINKCRDLRTEKKQITYTDQMPEMPFYEEEYASKEWAQVLEPLDNKYRLVILLYYMEGFNIREISDILDMKESTVKSRLQRGRKQVAEMYQYKVREGRCLMTNLNNNEMDFQEKLQKDTEIPVIVHERINQAYRMIENDTAMQKKAPKDPYHWMKVGGRIAGGVAAALAVGFVFYATNPVMAKNIPVVGGLFDILQDNVSFFSNFADHATTLETIDGAEAEETGNTASDSEKGNQTESNTAGKEETAPNATATKEDTAYTKTVDGLTITCSEVFANSQAVYMTMQLKSDTPFPETETIAESGTPVIDLDMTGGVDFNADADPVIDGQVEGQFLDDKTYACIFRYDLAQASKDYTEYNEKYNEMTQQVLDEMGVTQDDLNDETDEGYALLEEFINKVSERGGEYQKYIKDIEIPDTFNLHLDITKVRGLEADYEWSEDDYEKYGTDAGYYKYEGDWNFDIPVTVDDSQTEILELNDTNDAGIGLKSVIRTPYELTENELYEDGSDSDCFMVALDANGNKLPYNDSAGNCNIFAIQDRDISTVDIYILDYTQYMDELKGPDNYNNNENKPEGQRWSDLLDQYAKYHKTLHFK